MSRHTKILTRSFAGGEMSPEMFSRVDDLKYQAGAETLLNCIPRPTGAVARRSGTRLVRATRDSDFPAMLFSFVFSQTQSVVVEASRAMIGGVESGYFRFHANGGTLLYPRPERFKSAITTLHGGFTFGYTRTIEDVTVGPDAVFTITAHGLRKDAEIYFHSPARTFPGGVSTSVTYYVELHGTTPADKFYLREGSASGPRLTVTDHGGYAPLAFNFTDWKTNATAVRSVNVGEHRVQNKEAVVLTMWPDGNSPTVYFSGNEFHPTQVVGGYAVGLSSSAVMAQQVMFVADPGSTMPTGLEEGRLYWATGKTSTGWTLSETFGGPVHPVGTIGGGMVVRMCAMPEITAGSVGAKGEFGAMHRYYAVANANDGNLLRLETSIAAGQAVGGGLAFHPDHHGCGPFKIHRAYEIGDLAAYYDAAGDAIKDFYCQKNWWENVTTITEEMHNGAGSRTPGSGQRTAGDQAAYWREIPGRPTSSSFPATADDYVAPGTAKLTLTSFDGGHGLAVGQQVAIVDGQVPAGVDIRAPRYVSLDNFSSTSFEISTSYALAVAGGNSIAAPNAEAPRHGAMLVQGFVEFNTANFDQYVIWPGHSLNNGDTIVFEPSLDGTDQDGVVPGTVYYVRDKTGDDTVVNGPKRFRISLSAAGPLAPLSGTDGHLIAAIGNAIYEAPHSYTSAELAKIVTTQSGDVMTLASQDHPVTELRRISSTKWEIAEPEFIAAVAVPGALYEDTIFQGEGTTITQTEYEGSRHRFVTENATAGHQFTAGTPVYVDGLPTSGAGSLADGYYIVGHPSGLGNQAKNIYLQDVESGENVTHGGKTDSQALDGRIRYGTQGEERTQKYVVTAIDQNSEESAATAPLTVTNNVFVAGASNLIGWGASVGAVRYRVYKELSGLYGLIGETNALTFKDDNIGPDLGISPPIPDSSLRKTAVVTFDKVTDSVAWVGHELVTGDPIVFETTDQMPDVVEGATYYVINPGTDDFQIVSDPTSETPAVLAGDDIGTHTAVTGNFPSTASYFEGRRIFGGSRSKPQDIWMTASGTESDLTYSIPTVDSDRIYFRIASRELSSIRHLIPMSQLILLSDSTEYRLTPLNDDALTPTTISVRPQSFIGAGYPTPSLVNNTAVFAASRGGHMRELGYSRDGGGYLTGDLSIRAAHLFDGLTIVDQAYAKAPLPVVWCVSSNGKLLGLTYIPEENVAAWHQHTTPGGTFEAVTSVPEGDEDAVYVVVNRGGTRYVERFADEYRGETAALPDAFFVDCGLTYDGAATTTVSGLDHLTGETVSYLADGLVGTGLVTAGALTLTTAASVVQVGIPFTSQIKTLPLSMMRVDAFGSGRQKNINQVWVRLFQSGAFSVGVDESDLRPSLTPAPGVLLTDLVQVTLPASWDDDGQVFIQQTTPLPLTVSGLTIEVASGG